ncbi:MAG: MFS transporter [Chlorobiaceae bacterium]|nr:MFS transporter [Chlorobiaceae bacterium]
MQVRKEEISKVVITWSMVALLAIGYSIGWSAVHSMLVKRMGIQYLPYTYIGISLLGMVGSSVYLMFADKVRRDRLLIIFAFVTGVLLLLARTLVSANQESSPGFTFQLFLFFMVVFFAQGVGNSTLGTQVWTIISDLFTPSQGRRLYPIVGTAGTIGGIAGGASIHFLADSMGTANLTLVWAFSVLALVPLTIMVRRQFGGELGGRSKGASGNSEKGAHLKEGASFFLRSPMAVVLGFVAVMFWVVGSVADFQYTRIMNAAFPSEARLAGFYGIYGMVINITGLLVQVLFSGYLIRRIGVSRGLCALPLTVLAGFVFITLQPVFWAGFFLRFTWDLVGMTVQGNSYQLAQNAMPSALRARIRGFIEGVVNPLGGVLGGLLILGLHAMFDATDGRGWSDEVTISGILLGILWIVVVLGSQKHYLNLIADNLKSPDKRTVMDAIECLVEPGSGRAGELLDQVAAMPDAERRAVAARVRGSIPGEASQRALCHMLHDPAPSVRAEALCSLSKMHGGHALPQAVTVALQHVVETDPEPAIRVDAFKLSLSMESPESWDQKAREWLVHESETVRKRIVEAVGTQSGNRRKLLEPMLGDSSGVVVAAVVRALWEEPGMKPVLTDRLAGLLADGDPEVVRAALATCHLVGELPVAFLPAGLLGSSDPAARILAGAGMVRFGAEPSLREAAVGVMCRTLVEEAERRNIKEELLPLLPDLGEEAIDSLLFGVAALSAEDRERVSGTLGGVYDMLDSRMSLSEIIQPVGQAGQKR